MNSQYTVSQPKISQIEESLYLIGLPVPLPGFDEFIGAWVRSGDPTVVIDVGPSISAPLLLSALAQIGLKRIDLILLTHAHIDHAGGLGMISDAFPQATVVCHPQALRHLIDPHQLWQGSLQTLGKVAQAYGAFGPVAEQRLLAADKLAWPAIVPIATPGHASHHYSYQIDRFLFAGEAAGVCLALGNGEIYLRPATPPRFFMETYLKSLESLMACQAQTVCYGHLGSQPNAQALLQAHHDQILRWHRLISRWFESAQADPQTVMEACRDDLIAQDPLLGGFSHLAPEVQQREKEFLMNAVKGFWGYLAGR